MPKKINPDENKKEDTSVILMKSHAFRTLPNTERGEESKFGGNFMGRIAWNFSV